MSLISSVRDTVSRHDMIRRGDNVIACLSGGADSVCLLAALDSIKDELGISLSAVHVNHCLRGDESDGDMRFCEELCRNRNIPIKVFHVDVNRHSMETGKSTEEAARELRYEAFEKASSELGGAKLATAHNKCDNSETVIFNLARGTGIKGICGIPYVRGNIIRPLLDVSRQEIEEFLAELGEHFVTDSSNLTDDYSRNVIRHNVVPVLTGINSNFHEAASRLSRSAAEDEEYFCGLLEKISDEDICGYPAAVRKRYIRKKLNERGIECSFERLNILDGMMSSRKNTRYDLSGDLFAVFENGRMEIKKISPEMYKDICIEPAFDDGNAVYIAEFDKTVKIERVSCENLSADGNVNKKLTNCYLNYDKIQGVVSLRNKRDGDCIGLVGRDFDTRLKKLFNSMKLSADERHRALVMEDENGLVWSEYGGVSRRVHASCDDAAIYRITVTYGRL